MGELALSTFFAMGLGLGVLHAFDPDHVAAVTGMAAGQNERSKTPVWRFALHWSLGHGGILFLVAACVFLFGAAIPTAISEFAEQCVAFVLIAIGLNGYWKLLKARYHKPQSWRHGASFVGMLHGTAGSAPLLALIPITQLSQPVVGVVYVIFFGVGVSLAMMGLGGLLFQGMKRMRNVSWHYQCAFHLVLASFSFLLGIYLLIE